MYTVQKSPFISLYFARKMGNGYRDLFKHDCANKNGNTEYKAKPELVQF